MRNAALGQVKIEARVVRWRAACGLAILLASVAWAQVGGTLSGRVVTHAGVPLAGASVTVCDEAHNAERSTVSDARGRYVIALLAPGEYKLRAAKAGAGQVEIERVVVALGTSVEADLTLDEKAEQRTARVVQAPAQSHELERIAELPVASRNPLELARLGAAVTPGTPGERLAGKSELDPRAATSYNAVGAQANANAWLLDGVVNNESTFNTVVVLPSPESVSELALHTTAPASLGRGGAVAALVTPSGGNAWHGEAFEANTNRSWVARPYFTPAADAKPQFIRNQFGVSAGGALKRNRVFVYGEYTAERAREGDTFLNTVPSAAAKRGDFSAQLAGAHPATIYDPTTTHISGLTIVRNAYAGNVIPAAAMSTVGLNVASLYPDPNLALAQTANRADEFTRRVRDDGGTLRVDWYAGPRTQAYARWSEQSYSLLDATPDGGCCLSASAALRAKFDLGPYVAGALDSDVTARGGALVVTHSFSPRTVNQLVLGLAHLSMHAMQSDYGHNATTSLGIAGLNIDHNTSGLPAISIQSVAGVADYTTLNGGPSALPEHPETTLYQWEDHHAAQWGRHALEFGYRGVRLRESPYANRNARGALAATRSLTSSGSLNQGGDGLATLLLGYLNTASRDYLLQPYTLSRWEHSAWVQDTARYGRVSVNAGLRWDLFTPEVEDHDRLSNFDLSNKLLLNAGANGVTRSGNLATHGRNFGPRLGLAWDVFGTGSTVLRSAYALSYFPSVAGLENMLGQNVPWSVAQSVTLADPYPLDLSVVPRLAAPLPTAVAAQPASVDDLNALSPTLTGRAPQNETPYLQSWNLSVERRIARAWLASIGYAGSRGLHLLSAYNPQEVLPGPAIVDTYLRLTVPALYNVRSILYTANRNMSNYHALTARVERHYTAGLTLLATYTWSKSLDYGGAASSLDTISGVPQTITNFKAAYGRSTFDRTHRFTANAVWALPFGPGARFAQHGTWARIAGGWSVATIVVAETGLPFTVYLSDGVTNGGPSWPDRVGNGTLANPSRAAWFDPTAFVAPSTARYGNSGRAILSAPGLVNADIGLSKTLHVGERITARLRLDAFNVTNTPHFGFPQAAINTVAPASTDTSITSVVGASRQLRGALYVSF